MRLQSRSIIDKTCISTVFHVAASINEIIIQILRSEEELISKFANLTEPTGYVQRTMMLLVQTGIGFITNTGIFIPA
jgi:hypothetical protein